MPRGHGFESTDDTIKRFLRERKPYAQDIADLVIYRQVPKYDFGNSMMASFYEQRGQYLLADQFRDGPVRYNFTDISLVEQEYINMYVEKLRHGNYSTFSKRERLEGFSSFLHSCSQNVTELHQKAREIIDNEQSNYKLDTEEFEELLESIQQDLDEAKKNNSKKKVSKKRVNRR